MLLCCLFFFCDTFIFHEVLECGSCGHGKDFSSFSLVRQAIIVVVDFAVATCMINWRMCLIVGMIIPLWGSGFLFCETFVCNKVLVE